MKTKEIVDGVTMKRAITRMTYEIIERNKNLDNIVLAGIKTRGVFIARRIQERLKQIEGLDESKRVINYLQEVAEEVKTSGGSTTSIAELLEQFLFPRSMHGTLIEKLSGGEKKRLYLLKLLLEKPNVLLLDEPTNDLDVETLASLENALLEFPGCAVVITHDRWFLDRVATHILAWEGTEDDPANWYWFEGNFESYEKNKVDRLGAEAARPHRVTHRRLRRA